MITQQRIFDDEPTLRIKIAESTDSLDFKPDGSFSVFDAEGKRVFRQKDSAHIWRISLEKYAAPRFVYYIVVDERRISSAAEEAAGHFIQDGFSASVAPAGCEILIGGSKVGENRVYQIRIGPFETIEEGRSLLARFPAGKIIRQRATEPKAEFEIYDTDYAQSVRVEGSFSIVPEKSEGITLLHVGEGAEGSRTNGKDRHVRGGVDFLPDSEKGFIAVAEIPLETYLKHVVTAEMRDDFPSEALKSQAVASRSWALATLGLQHRDDPFDICCGPHCHLFCGNPDISERVRTTVEETRGEMLYWKGQLCQALSTAVCGGHTDDAILAQIAPSVSYLKSREDAIPGESKDGFLKEEDHVAFWVSSQPDVFCNPRRGNGNPDERGLKAFRWEVNYTRAEVERILLEKTGVDIGILFDILPRKRGASGRLYEIEILGSHRNLTLRNEMEIRNALSSTSLFSSCFIVEMDLGADGVPVEVSLIGAGHGHGVGLCKAGAVAMAAEGHSYEAILRHYFSDVSLKKLY